MHIVLDSFRNIVGSKVQTNVKSCSKKLNSISGLTDKVGQDTPSQK